MRHALRAAKTIVDIEPDGLPYAMKLAALVLLFAVGGGLVSLWLQFEASQEAAFWDGQQTLDHQGLEIRDPDGALKRFSKALTFKTVGKISADNCITNKEPFEELHAFLAASFPKVWKLLEPETVSEFSLLFKWGGTAEDMLPGLLMSHMDVVPVSDSDVSAWKHPPFGGQVADGYVWGRGALDVKVTLMSILEAVEELLMAGFKPRRTLYLAFGHDEETGGRNGAVHIVKRLKTRGVSKLQFVLDEGGCIMMDGFSSLARMPVGLVGTAEKGIATVELSIKTAGGHSSMPPLDGSTVGSIMARVLSRLDKAPINPSMLPPTSDMLLALVPVAPMPLRPVLRHVSNDMVGFLIAQAVGAAGPEGAAMTRTTLTATGFSGGVAHNVMPQTGKVILNSRIMPGETVHDVLHYINVTGVAGDARFVNLTVLMSQDPSPVSNCSSDIFATVRQAILDVFQPGMEGGKMIVVPHLVVGGTDSRHYTELTSEVFRFAPLILNKTAGDLGLFHANDERVTVSNYHKAISFYKRFITLSAK
mmetsp:Transcript_5665/g.15866  ORF Transcript_5665/g.15866 Transcript_5665/m.15866 type:complete len:533 (-) Transcript_5665:112-1710(-)